MASVHNLFILVAFVTAFAKSQSLLNPSPVSLAARLKLEGEPSNCWESLFQLQACSGEVINFFINGEAYLGHGCCPAMRVIGHDYWPNIVGLLGFTTEETDLLKGYCDEALPSRPPPPSVVEPKDSSVKSMTLVFAGLVI